VYVTACNSSTDRQTQSIKHSVYIYSARRASRGKKTAANDRPADQVRANRAGTLREEEMGAGPISPFPFPLSPPQGGGGQRSIKAAGGRPTTHRQVDTVAPLSDLTAPSRLSRHVTIYCIVTVSSLPPSVICVTFARRCRDNEHLPVYNERRSQVNRVTGKHD